MSEPYSPIWLESLGIEYIQDETKNEFRDQDIKIKSMEINSISRKRELYIALRKEIEKRSIKSNIKKKRLFI